MGTESGSADVMQIQIACRDGKVLTAPLQGPVALDIVFTASADDIDGVERAIDAALRNVPPSREGWETLDRSRSPFQKAEGIRTVREFERNLRLMMLSSTGNGIALVRFIPFDSQKRGFVIDDKWKRDFPRGTPLREVAACVSDAVIDKTWPVR